MLRITTSTSFGISHLGRAVAEFMTRNPSLPVQVLLEDQTMDLEKEGFHVGVRVGARVDHPVLRTRRLAPIRRIFCASPAYLARAGRPKNPDELRAHRCMFYSSGERSIDWRLKGPKGETSVHVEGAYLVNSGMAVRDALVASHGIGLLPTYIVGPDVKAGRLARLMADYDTAIELALFTAWPKESAGIEGVDDFLEFLGQRFCDPPDWDDFATVG